MNNRKTYHHLHHRHLQQALHDDQAVLTPNQTPNRNRNQNGRRKTQGGDLDDIVVLHMQSGDLDDIVVLHMSHPTW
jgi:hypothetical protein